MMPVNLSDERDGILFEVISGFVKGDESWILYSLQGTEGKDPGTPYSSMLWEDFIGDPDWGEDPLLYVNEKEHKAYFCSHTKYQKPIAADARAGSMGACYYESRQVVRLDALQLLKEYGTTSEGMLCPERLPGVNADGTPLIHEKVKVLDYNQPQLNIPVIGDVVLTGIGWIDGDFHVQLHNPNARPMAGRYVEATSNWDAYPEYETGWREDLIDYVVWDETGDGSMDWSEIVLHCDQEYLEKMKLQIEVSVLYDIVDGDWKIELPLNMICPEAEPATEEPKAQSGNLLNEVFNYEGTEVQLHAVDLNCEKQGMRVEVIGGLATGNECWVKYSVQDVENRYSGLEIDPEGYINTICPEDAMSAGELDPVRTEVMTMHLGTDEVTHTSTFLTRSKHSWPILNRGQSIVFGLKDLKFTRHTTVDLRRYVEEYAKPEEGKITRAYVGEQKILDTAERLNIPMGRDDVLLTGIGWIDNKLHVRFEYTGEGEFLKNGKTYGQACNVWIDGEYTDPAKAESRVDFTMLTGSDKAGATPNRFEAILECSPDNYREVSLKAQIEVTEDAVQDEWAVSFPLSAIYEESEPAEEVPETEAPAPDAADSDFTIDGTTLLKYNGKGGEVTVPEGIEILEKEAFQYNEVTKVNLPETLKEIGSHCFYGCDKLNEITLPASLEGLEEETQVFGSNPALTAFSVAEGNQYYKAVDGVLFTADGKTLLYYPDGRDITEYSIPEGTEKLHEASFGGRYLETLNIPSTLEKAGEGFAAFAGLPNLQEINVSPDNHTFRSLNGVLYTSDTLMCYPNAKEGTALKAEDFPAGLKRIEDNAFSGNICLETVELPEGLEYLGSKSFLGAGSLKTVMVPASVTEIGYFTFTACSKLERVTILNPDVQPDDYTHNDPKTYNMFWEANKNAVLCGYEGGKLEKYAEKSGLKFEPIATWSKRPIKIEMTLDRATNVRPLDIIEVNIEVTNISGYDLPGKVSLYDPAGNQLYEKEIAPGETYAWGGKWTVTEDQLTEGKITFAVKYQNYKEDMEEVEWHKLNFSQSISRE